MMSQVSEIIHEIKLLSSKETKDRQAYFGVKEVNNYGLTSPQIKSLAKRTGKNHALALELWKTGIHEAKHIAVLIADPRQVNEKLMENWMKDFNSWDIVDNCCGTLFDKTPFAFEKAIQWSCRKKEFEKRAGFAMMATLALHDKKAKDDAFEIFFPFLLKESHDERNFVFKAINWALRQIGKRNERLCRKAIKLSMAILEKKDASSRWIASDALRELRKYLSDGRIKDIGSP